MKFSVEVRIIGLIMHTKWDISPVEHRRHQKSLGIRLQRIKGKGDCMGLFDIFKKKAHHGQETGLRGDLAHIADTPPEEDQVSEWDELEFAGENVDSADSEVFLTFDSATRKVWTCLECGTTNDTGLNGCVVCGRKK